jgi:hypothetical protein
VALVRGRRFLPPFVAWAAVVLGVLALVPIVGFFATMFAGIWLVVISLMLFARWEAVARLWEDATRRAHAPDELRGVAAD